MRSIADTWRREGQYAFALSCFARLLGMAAEYRLAMEWGIPHSWSASGLTSTKYVAAEDVVMVTAAIKQAGLDPTNNSQFEGEDAYILLHALGDTVFFDTFNVTAADAAVEPPTPTTAAHRVSGALFGAGLISAASVFSKPTSTAVDSDTMVVDDSASPEEVIEVIASISNMRNHSQLNHGFRSVSEADVEEARQMSEHMFKALHIMEGATGSNVSAHLSCILTPTRMPSTGVVWSDDVFADNVWVDDRDRRISQPRG
jgi:hypothetical protein